MLFLPVLAAISASAGWALGSVLAERPAHALGAFEFTRIQFNACAAILIILCTGFSLWSSASVKDWPAYATSIVTAVIGHLALTACLRRGGARRIEVVLSLRAPIVAVMAYAWLGETLDGLDAGGGAICLMGVVVAILSKNAKQAVNNEEHPKVGLFIALGLLATASNGVGYLVMKPALEGGTNPLVVSAIRLLGAAFILSVLGLWPLKAFHSQTPLTPALLFQTILPGIIGYVVASSLLFYAFSTLDAGIAAVLGSLAPILILPIQVLRDRKTPSAGAASGAMLAVIGAMIIVSQK